MGYSRAVRRAFALALIIVCLAPGTWWRPPYPVRIPIEMVDFEFVGLRVPPPDEQPASLGPFVLEDAWHLKSGDMGFGGYSGLVALGDGQLLAISDSGHYFRFSAPGAPYLPPKIGRPLERESWTKKNQDIESATADISSATVWAALEDRNAIVRFGLSADGLTLDGIAEPPLMSGWEANRGPESLVRLRDGRFLVLSEAFEGLFETRAHEGLVFARDPVETHDARRFTLAGPDGFRPTDAALMPDGRVLVLFRRLDWPLPARFSIRIGLGDPETIRPGKTWRVAQISEFPRSLPIDNFEGLAIEPRRDGKLTVWLISDDNRAAFQATYLLKMALDPADLPRP